jgi:hypothetical protein
MQLFKKKNKNNTQQHDNAFNTFMNNMNTPQNYNSQPFPEMPSSFGNSQSGIDFTIPSNQVSQNNQGFQQAQGFQQVHSPQGFQQAQGFQQVQPPQGFQQAQGFQQVQPPQGYQQAPEFQQVQPPQGYQQAQGFQQVQQPQNYNNYQNYPAQQEQQIGFPQPPITPITNQYSQNNITNDFPFPQDLNEINSKINSIDLTIEEQNDNSAKFTIQEPKNLGEAKRVIYELIQRVHFLESQLNSLETNYDTERKLSKRKLDAFDGQTKILVTLIQEVMQQQKYKYEKDNGEISNLSYKDLIEFLKLNIKESFLVEKQKNAKLFTALKEMEEVNRRLESQLAHNNVTSGALNNSNQNVFSNTTNVDKINAILGNKEESKNNKEGNNSVFNHPPEPVHTKLDTNQSVNTNSGKILEIKQDIQSFSADSKDLTLQKTEEDILKVVGDTGVDNHDYLVKELENLRANLNPTSFKSMLYNHRKKLIDKGLIETTIIELPMKGYNKVELFKLSIKGIEVYQQLYRKAPVQSNMTKRLNQHSSYEHAFFIDKISEHLISNKYELINDEKGLRFPVEVSGNEYHLEFDLICKKADQSYYIEAEMGTTSDKDYMTKLDKNYAFSKINKTPILFIYPSKKKAEESMTKVNNWLNARGGYKKIHNEKSFKIIMSYFEEVKSNAWLSKPEFFIDLTT